MGKAVIKVTLKAGEFKEGLLDATQTKFDTESYLTLSPKNAKTGNIEPLVFGLDIEKVEAQPGGKGAETSIICTLRDGRRFLIVCQSGDVPDIQSACLVVPQSEQALAAIQKWKSPEEIKRRTQEALIVPIAIGSIVLLFFFGVSSSGRNTQRSDSSATRSEEVVSRAPELPATKLVDVPSLVGKTQKQVSAVLGKSTCETENVSRVGKVPTCTYDKGSFEVEITFINNKADWISVGAFINGLPYKPDALTAIGLPEFSGYTEGRFNYSWKGAGGYHEILMFKHGENLVDYIYVKAVTD